MDKKKIGIVILIVLAIVLLYLNQTKNQMIEDLKTSNLDYISKYNNLEKENIKLIIAFNKNIEEKKSSEKRYFNLLEKYNKKISELSNLNKRDYYINNLIEDKYNVNSKTIELDLLKKSDIIKIHKDQPWKMRFSEVHLLSANLAFASFDDGHGQGYGIYKFKIENNMIIWEMIYESMD